MLSYFQFFINMETGYYGLKSRLMPKIYLQKIEQDS
jgi:hypothetical protein